MADLLQSAAAYLKTDALKHIVHLKMIEAYAEHITCRYERRGAQEGALLLIPTPVSPFDAKTYPGSKFVVLLAGSDQETVGRLVRHIPRQTSLVFKLVDDVTKDAVLQAFPCRRMATFVSYTAGERHFRPHSSVVTSATLDERVLPCYQANGYTLGELEGFFKHGALSFTIYEDAPSPFQLVSRSRTMIKSGKSAEYIPTLRSDARGWPGWLSKPR